MSKGSRIKAVDWSEPIHVLIAGYIEVRSCEKKEINKAIGGYKVILEILYMLYTIRKQGISSFQNAQNFYSRVACSKVIAITVKVLWIFPMLLYKKNAPKMS